MRLKEEALRHAWYRGGWLWVDLVVRAGQRVVMWRKRALIERENLSIVVTQRNEAYEGYDIERAKRRAFVAWARERLSYRRTFDRFMRDKVDMRNETLRDCELRLEITQTAYLAVCATLDAVSKERVTAQTEAERWRGLAAQAETRAVAAEQALRLERERVAQMKVIE